MDDFRHLNKTTNGGSSSAEQRVGAAAAAAATVAAGDSKHWPQAVRELKGVDAPRRYPTCKSTMRFLSRTAGSRARRLPSHRAPAFAHVRICRISRYLYRYRAPVHALLLPDVQACLLVFGPLMTTSMKALQVAVVRMHSGIVI